MLGKGDTPLHPLAISNINKESSTSTSRVPYRFVLRAIHCIAFFFSFSLLTLMELLIWRILSVAITAVPIYIFFDTLSGWLAGRDDGAWETQYYCSLFCDFISRQVLASTSLGTATWSILDHSLDYLHTSCINYISISISYLHLVSHSPKPETLSTTSTSAQ